MRWSGALVATVVATTGHAWAQQPVELVTDRPDQTESAVAVPRGSIQVEIGAGWAFDRQSDVELKVLEVPGTLIRYGLVEGLELRLAWAGWTGTLLDAGSQRRRASGLADPEVGVKWALLDPGDRGLALAVMSHVSLPVGHEIVGAPRTDPSVRLAVAYGGWDRVSVGGNLGYELVSFESRQGGVATLGRWIYSGAAGLAIGSRWGVFLEMFGDLPGSDPGPAAHLMDGGVTFRASPRVQLDLSAGFGLNRDAPDRFVGFGVSFRRLR